MVLALWFLLVRSHQPSFPSLHYIYENTEASVSPVNDLEQDNYAESTWNAATVDGMAPHGNDGVWDEVASNTNTGQVDCWWCITT
ncbi:hypothetical protein P175DRAFT_0504752 [Aspergillus ochraceoroseus IBT 24754]|uniref:Uncharacterized protein n=1 Tax=Aspergillus ochraceoroseus IBT 24754 TaxID=1392256 RepID=A0A2T5LMF2_9EURO|nr:uncharacterized protein P175DRAFT_0504752 [Aspergillus ochraceoroseus IBT 24754]PTU17460.1 hypothetical protein P175DRAFT_0504752 [Aspergillus ochraceoroseus IBT 24754]